MPLSFYMDVQVPAAITEGLARRGIDVLTSQDDGTRETDDDLLLQKAATLSRILVTQDEDFLRIAAEWQRGGRFFAGLVFAPQQGPSIGRCIEDLHLIAECVQTEEIASRVVFIPLS